MGVRDAHGIIGVIKGLRKRALHFKDRQAWAASMLSKDQGGIINPMLFPLGQTLGSSRLARLQADALLLVVALIWGSTFVVQRLAAQHIGVFFFNGVRFLLAAFALAPLVAWQQRRQPTVWLSWVNLVGISLAGCLLVAGAGFQQAGLKTTTAANAGFITGLYVVWVPILWTLFWRRKVRRVIWLAVTLSAAGLYLLSVGGSLRFWRGDLLELMGAFCWALHVLLTDRMVRRLPVGIYACGQYTVCAGLNLFLGAAFEAAALPALGDNIWMVLYAGLLSVGVGYTLQAAAQRIAPPADAAILLSLEAVFAAIGGWLFLAESLSPRQILGCSLMLGAMVLSQFPLGVPSGEGVEEKKSPQGPARDG